MKQINSNTYRLDSLDELRPRAKSCDRAFGYDTKSGRFVGTKDDNITLVDYDHTDWSYREAQQQQINFDDEPLPYEAPDDDDQLPF